MKEENWTNFFRPNFSRAVDGPLRDHKLGVNEIIVVATLTAECLQHCSNLVSKASLQEHNLSDLGVKGILTLFYFSFILL